MKAVIHQISVNVARTRLRPGGSGMRDAEVLSRPCPTWPHHPRVPQPDMPRYVQQCGAWSLPREC